MKTEVGCCYCGKLTGRTYEGKMKIVYDGMCDECYQNRGVSPVLWTDEDLKEDQKRYSRLASS